MAVNATPPLPKSQPDIARINTFTGTTITVTKHTGPRNTVGQSVVPTQQMPVKQILDLMTSLPLTYGPGFYMFNCSDTGGTGDDAWMVRLGPEPQENSMSGPGFPPPPGSAAGGPPLGEGVVHLGHGFYYNEAIGTLTTPWRRVYNWKQGDPMPEQPTNAPQLSLVPPNAQPGSWPQPAGWGTFPATDDSRALKEMEARMAAEERRREREDDQRRRQEEKDEQRRREDEQRRRDEARDAQMAELFKSLTAKPTGPSATELALQTKLEAQERRLEEQTREDARRREDQAREDRYRVERQADREKHEALLREIEKRDSSRPDPVLTMMTSLMTSTQQQASESVRAVREAATLATTANERHTSQIMEAMTRDKTGASEMTRQMLEGSKTMMEMQSSFYQQMLEQANSGGQPWFATAIQSALEKVGPIANAVAARAQAATPPQVQYTAPPSPPRRTQAAGAPIPSVAPQNPIPSFPARVETGERPEGVQHDPESDTFVISGGPGHPGYRVPAGYVRQYGWTATLNMLARQNAPSPVTVAAAAQAPRPVPPAAPVADAALGGGSPVTPITAKPKKPRKTPPAPVVVEPAHPAVPPPADLQKGYNRDELRGFDYDTMLAIVAPFDDATFFGEELWPFIQQMRSAQNEPGKVAEYILQGKAQLASAGKTAPATDVLEAEQLDVLVERLFPGWDEGYVEAVTKALATAMGLEVLEDAE